METLSIKELAKHISFDKPPFVYECELIRRMTLMPPSKFVNEAREYFHGDFSDGIVRVLAKKHYVEDFVYARDDYYAYLDEVRSEYNAFVVEPDPETGVLYGVLVKYQNNSEVSQSSTLSSFVMSCSIHHFINLYKERLRKNSKDVRSSEETSESAENLSDEESSRILLYKMVCPDDTMSNEEIVKYGNDLLDRIISFLPPKEQDVIRLTYYEGLAGVEAFNRMYPDSAETEEIKAVRKNKQDYVSHLRARALDHMIQIKKKLYHE